MSRSGVQSGLKTIKCQYHDRGYCTHCDKCNNKNPDKVCHNINCREDQCDRRHPNPCKFGMRFKFYKKKVCSYSNVTFAFSDEKTDALEKDLKLQETKLKK